MEWMKRGISSAVIGVLGMAALSGGAISANAYLFSLHLDDEHTKPARTSAAVSTPLPDGRRLDIFGAQGKAYLADAMHIERLTLPDIRRDASVTVMPTGQVLLWGGMDAKGHVLSDGLWFDPDTLHFVRATDLGLPARAGHTLSVLPDGQLLMTGGWTDDQLPATQALLWDVLQRQVTPVSGITDVARFGAKARLVGDGSIRIEGGKDTRGFPVATALKFDTATHELMSDDPVNAVAETDGPRVVTLPVPGSIGTPVRGPLAIHFSSPVNLRELATGKSVMLLGPNGIVATKVVGVEGGRLAFVQLPDDLYPGSRYTLFVQGLHTASGDAVPYTAVGFTTAQLQGGVAIAGQGGVPTASYDAPSSPPLTLVAGEGKYECRTKSANDLCRTTSLVKDGAWYPGLDNVPDATGGHWRLYHPRTTLPDTHKQEAMLAKNATALIGQVRRIDESPVANVEISIGERKVRTDAQGVFVLDGLVEGRQEVFVDGRTASQGAVEYGRFMVGADVKAASRNRMPFVMYLPRVLARDKITLPSPTTREVVLTHPEMPGLELHIPAGVVLKDREGKVLTELAIVPTPVDRAPFPLPANFPMYFTIQPGDAVVQGLSAEAAKGIRVVYPNYGKEPPKTGADFWVYDVKRGWQMYGKGQVTADAQHLAPDPGVSLVWALGAGASIATGEPPGSIVADNKCAGEPVDLQSGVMFHRWNDLAIADIAPLVLNRSYRSDDTVSHAFGVGGSSNLGMHLYSSNGFTTPQLVLNCGESISFKLISGSTTWPLTPATVWQHTATNSAFYGATMQFLFDTTPDGAHWILTMRDGSQMAFTRHAPNTLSWMQDRFGNRVQLTYNGGLLDQVISPSGRAIAFSYDTKNRVTTATDHTNRQVQYAYDTGGSLNKVTYPDNTNEQYTYDTSKRMLTMQDRRGTVWVTNQYDSNGRVTKQTYADHSFYQFDYTTENGQPVTTVTDPNGHVERTVFDPVSKYPLSETRAYGTPLAQTVTYTRGATGLVDSVIDPRGRKTAFVYDTVGNVTKVTRLADTPQAVNYQFTYTSDYSQLATITDPLNHTTSFTYENGCLAQVVDPLNHASTMLCNSAGQPTVVEDALGRLTHFSYQGYDLQSVTDPLQRTVTFTVDALGRRVATRDPLGVVTLTQYDSNDRPVSATDGLNQTTTLNYDGNGNPLTVTLPDQHTVTNTYDLMNRRTVRTDALNQNESWTYDAMGNPRTYTDRKQQVTQYDYDALDRRTLVTYADGSGTQASYDNANRLTELLDTTSGSMTWGYDELDRITQAVTPQGTIGYSYDAAGRRTGMTPAAQAAVSYAYDNANRLSSITQGSEIVQFAYDNGDRRTQLTLPNGVTVAYGYDDGDQLTSLNYKQGNGTALGDLSYSYDIAGRVIGQGGSLAFNQLPAPTTQPSTFDANNRQTSFNGATLTYDANGNLTSDGTNTFVWNARDQLVKVMEGGTPKLSYSYDAMGRRTSKTVDTATPTQYLYDGDNAVQEQEGAAINPILAGLGIDERFARNDVTGRTYFLADMLGSTIGLADAAGQIKQQYRYDPYGNVSATDTTSGFTNPYQYTGREADTAGLYYYRARYYSPGMGRFVSEDPLGFQAGQLNLYAYASAGVLNYSDPLGLWAIGDPLPNWLADGITGMGDGVYSAITFGLGDLQDVRDITFGGSPDTCSSAYGIGHFGGEVLGSAALGGAALRKVAQAAGPLRNWVRIKPSYSRTLQTNTRLSLSWGASPARNGRYLQEIPSEFMRHANQWLRARRLPFGGLRSVDAGHFHIFW